MFQPKTFVPDQQAGQQPQAFQPRSFVPKSFVADRPTTAQQVGGVVKSIAQPFINTGKNIGGAVAELARKPFIDQSSVNVDAAIKQSAEVNRKLRTTTDPIEKARLLQQSRSLSAGLEGSGEMASVASSVSNPFLNEQELTKVSQPLSLQKGSALRQQIGDSANIASYAVPFGKGANILTKAILPGAAVGGLNAMTAEADPLDVVKGAGGGALFGGATYGAGQLFKRLPGVLSKQSEEVVTRGVGNPQKQIDLAKRGGRSVGSFMKEYNVLDRSPQTANEAKDLIFSQYDDLALRSGKQVPTGKIVSAIDDEIAKLQGGAGKFSDANQSKIAELTRRKEQFLDFAGATAESSPIKTGVKEATLFRRESLDPDIPKSMFNLDAVGSGKAQGAKATRDILRDAINSSDPRLEKLGLDYGMAKGIEKILTQAQSRTNNRQLLNFTKLGSAGVGGLLGGLPGAALGFFSEQLFNHPIFVKALSNTLSAGATGQTAINSVLANPQVQQVIYQLASRAGGEVSRFDQTTPQTRQTTETSEKYQPTSSSTPIIPRKQTELFAPSKRIELRKR